MVGTSKMPTVAAVLVVIAFNAWSNSRRAAAQGLFAQGMEKFREAQLAGNDTAGLEESLSLFEQAGGRAGGYFRGIVLVELGRFDEAESLLVAGLDYDLRHRGPHHPNTLNAKQGLAAIYRQQDRNELAVRLYEECLEGARVTYGSDHVTTIRMMHNLALAYFHARRLGDARISLMRSEQLGFPVNAEFKATLQRAWEHRLASKGGVVMVGYEPQGGGEVEPEPQAVASADEPQ